MIHPSPTSRPRRSRSRRPRAERRGIAMLLVIIALGAATALTSVYLSSRRNSGLIGRNAATSAGAQWAARAAADLAVASMQTDSQWRDLVDDGVLFDNIALSGAAVAALVTDLEGRPPEDDDADLVVTGVASVDGVTATSQRIVSVVPEATLDAALNPYLDEFAVYVGDQLTLGGDAIIATWPDSPRSRLSPPLKIGAGSRSADTFSLDTTAAVVQGFVYLPTNPSSGMRAVAGEAPFVGSHELAVDPPVVPPSVEPFDGIPDHTSGGGGSSPLIDLLIRLGWRPPPGWGGTPTGNLRYTGSGSTASVQDGRYNDLTVENGAVVTLGSTLATSPVYYSFDDVLIQNDAVLIVVGVVRLQARDAFEVLNGACIELANQASRLEIVLHGPMEIEDSGVGVPRAVARDSARSLDDVPSTARAASIRILATVAAPDFSSPLAGPSDPSIEIDNASIVVAAIHAPETDVKLDDGSVLVGRVTAEELDIDDGAALLYDPALDNRAGFTNINGPLYTPSGDPIDGLESALASLPGDTTIESLATYVTGFIDTLVYDTLNLTKSLITGLLGGGTSAPSDPSPRSGSLAVPLGWPMDAFAVERDASVAIDGLSGTFVLIDPLVAQNTIIGTDLITKSTGSPPVTTLDRTAAPIEPTFTLP